MQFRNLKEKVTAFDAYGGAICACCGETEWCFLSLDHISGGGNSERQDFFQNKYIAGHHMFRELKLRGFPPGYQVLCMNCNVGRYRNGGVCPHKGATLSGAQRLAAFDVLRVGSDGTKKASKRIAGSSSVRKRRKIPETPLDRSMQENAAMPSEQEANDKALGRAQEKQIEG
jgi:hypothetical protein